MWQETYSNAINPLIIKGFDEASQSLMILYNNQTGVMTQRLPNLGNVRVFQYRGGATRAFPFNGEDNGVIGINTSPYSLIITQFNSPRRLELIRQNTELLLAMPNPSFAAVLRVDSGVFTPENRTVVGIITNGEWTEAPSPDDVFMIVSTDNAAGSFETRMIYYNRKQGTGGLAPVNLLENFDTRNQQTNIDQYDNIIALRSGRLVFLPGSSAYIADISYVLNGKQSPITSPIMETPFGFMILASSSNNLLTLNDMEIVFVQGEPLPTP